MEKKTRKKIAIISILIILLGTIVAAQTIYNYNVEISDVQETWLGTAAQDANLTKAEYLQQYVAQQINAQKHSEVQVAYNDLADRCRETTACMEKAIPELEKIVPKKEE